MSEDDVKDRLSRRFDGENRDEDESNDNRDMDAMHESSAQSENRDKHAKRTQGEESEEADSRANGPWDVKSVREDWKALTSYLPESLYEKYDNEFDRVRYVSDEDWKKDRHFKPLIFKLGIEAIASMDGEELETEKERMIEEARKERKERKENNV